VRSVAFPCNHFTCGVCFDAFHANADGHKSCPYCRCVSPESNGALEFVVADKARACLLSSDIVAIDEIHKATKLRAKHILQCE
jgi:hypothetical protein